jgi:Uma2 family endonuclease
MDTAKPLPTPVIYPETDDMGEHETQFNIAVLLVPLLRLLVARLQRVARVGGNQFWYFVEGQPARCRAPDVYVVDGVAPTAPDRGAWFTWGGHKPAFALEVVSAKWKKDYDEAPGDYDAMRAKEVVVFDPGAPPEHRRRVRWQVFRRVRGRGLVRVFAGDGDRVESRELGCWIRLVDQDGNPRLRVAVGPHGDELLPTDAERAAVESAEKEAAVTRADAAEAEVARLREELARLRRS